MSDERWPRFAVIAHHPGFRWSDPVPIEVSWDAVCRCLHGVSYHTISITGRLGACHGPRILGLFGRCRCREFVADGVFVVQGER
jgi:hypothetical protein